MLLGSVKSSRHVQRLSWEKEKRNPFRRCAEKISFDLNA